MGLVENQINFSNKALSEKFEPVDIGSGLAELSSFDCIAYDWNLMHILNIFSLNLFSFRIILLGKSIN